MLCNWESVIEKPQHDLLAKIKGRNVMRQQYIASDDECVIVIIVMFSVLLFHVSWMDLANKLSPCRVW